MLPSPPPSELTTAGRTSPALTLKIFSFVRPGRSADGRSRTSHLQFAVRGRALLRALPLRLGERAREASGARAGPVARTARSRAAARAGGGGGGARARSRGRAGGGRVGRGGWGRLRQRR